LFPEDSIEGWWRGWVVPLGASLQVRPHPVSTWPVIAKADTTSRLSVPSPVFRPSYNRFPLNIPNPSPLNQSSMEISSKTDLTTSCRIPQGDRDAKPFFDQSEVYMFLNPWLPWQHLFCIKEMFPPLWWKFKLWNNLIRFNFLLYDFS
jgi:hypothetical protein